MSTEQNYVPGDSRATAAAPTVENDLNPSALPDNRQTPTPQPIAVAEFISRNTDLHGYSPGAMAVLLSDRLTATPVRYNTVLDGIALLRAFAPVGPKSTPAHFALMLNDSSIIRLLYIAANEGDRYDTGLYIAYTSETRPLITGLLSTNADAVLLATTRDDDDYCLTEGGLRWVDQLFWSLHTFDIEMIDYLLLYPDANVSRAWEAFGKEGMDEGVDINVLYEYGLPDAQTSAPLSAV